MFGGGNAYEKLDDASVVEATGTAARLVPMGVPLSSGLTTAPTQDKMIPIDPADSRYKLALPGPYPCIQVDLKPGDMTVKSASGSMLTLDPNMSLQAECEGSWLNGCALCCVGESCWFNHYRPKGGPADVLLAPDLTGDIVHYRLTGERDLVLQPGTFLASDDSVKLAGKCLGCTGCCATGSCCAVRLTGQGSFFFNAYGSVARYTLKPGEKRKIDSGYIVGWTKDDNFTFTLTKAADTVVGSCISAEGFAILFENKSARDQDVFVQTRSLRNLAKRLRPYLGGGGGGGGGSSGGGGGSG